MKILVISNMYPSADDPVYGTFVKVFYDNISRLNGQEDTTLIAVKGRYGKKALKYLKFYICILWNLIFKRYDLVYVHTITYPIPPIWLVSKFKKLPLVFNVHGSDLLGKGALVRFFHRMGHKLISNAKAIVSPSHYFVRRIKEYFPEYDTEKIIVSASGGVDTSVFRPVENTLSEQFTLGYVSRIDKGKGWEIYLHALKTLIDKGYDVRGIIAGRGAQTEQMKEMIGQLGLDGVVEYLGGVPRDMLAQVYSKFDIFCNASYLDESLGLVTIEAMACGVPVAGSDNAGIAECISDNENGLLFKVADPDDLVEKVIRYIDYPADVKEAFRTKAVESARKFETDVVMQELFEKLKRIA